jgi:hypothetical protein
MMSHTSGVLCQSGSPFPNSSGRRAMLTAIRRASSFVNIFVCSASVGLSRELVRRARAAGSGGVHLP